MKKIFSGIVGIFGGVAPIVIQIVAWFALLSPLFVIFDEYHVSFFWSLIILTVLELLIVIPFAQQCIQAVFWIWSAVLVSKDITLASPFYWIGAVLAALYFLSIAFGIIMGAVEWVNRSIVGSGATKEKSACKIRYCSHCGNLIDTETGKCTGCGRRKSPIKPILISLAAVFLLVGAVGGFYHFALPEIRYRKATSYIEQGDYSKANAVLEEIIDYKNSRELMHKHSYTEIVSQVDRTCDTYGYIIRRCVCGKEEKEVIKASHLFSEATCTEPEKCSRCGATSGEPLGHSDDAFCSRCGKRLFETQEYSGRGKGYIEGVSLPSGKYNITVTHDGNWNFIVRGLPDFYWGKNQLWVNEIGKVSYVYQEKLNAVRDGVINVKDADGSWTITIEAIK